MILLGIDRTNVAQHKDQCLAAVNNYEASDCIKCSLDQKSNCQLLQKDFVPRSFLLLIVCYISLFYFLFKITQSLHHVYGQSHYPSYQRSAVFSQLHVGLATTQLISSNEAACFDFQQSQRFFCSPQCLGRL